MKDKRSRDSEKGGKREQDVNRSKKKKNGRGQNGRCKRGWSEGEGGGSEKGGEREQEVDRGKKRGGSKKGEAKEDGVKQKGAG